MPVIQYIDVCKKFPGSSRYAVDRVSAEIESGEFITILGSSGCGKTTLLKLTNRLYDPDSGKIIVEGEDISNVDPVELRRRLGYVIQQVGLFPHMTIKENITQQRLIAQDVCSVCSECIEKNHRINLKK